MSKKNKVVETQEEETVEETVEETSEGEGKKESRSEKRLREAKVVEMSDGTKVTFGGRQNVITEHDVSTGTITFKVINGEIITWNRPEIPEMGEFAAKVYLFGLLCKVKQSIGATKVDEIVETLNDAIKAINDGKFDLRSGVGDSTPELSDMQKAWAIVKKDKYPDTTTENWGDLNDPTQETVVLVLNAWNGLSKEQKALIKSHSLVQEKLLQFKRDSNKLKEVAL